MSTKGHAELCARSVSISRPIGHVAMSLATCAAALSAKQHSRRRFSATNRGSPGSRCSPCLVPPDLGSDASLSPDWRVSGAAAE
eukprot:11782050-Alexandrium_andersonii.AAC.1